MKQFIKPVLLILLGVVIAFPAFIATMKVMVDTSTPAFCSACHEIKPAVEAWRASTHVNNGQGLAATCMDCHLPLPENTFQFFAMKTYHGVKDVFFHLMEGAEGYDKEEARKDIYLEAKNDVCLHCHKNILYMPTKRGAMRAHRSVIYAREGFEKKCLDCHYDLVHTPKQANNYKDLRQMPYRSRGLRPDIIGWGPL